MARQTAISYTPILSNVTFGVQKYGKHFYIYLQDKNDKKISLFAKNYLA